MWHKHVYAASRNVLCTSTSLGTEVPKERRIGRHKRRGGDGPLLFTTLPGVDRLAIEAEPKPEA
jgi:hypothetical protein